MHQRLHQRIQDALDRVPIAATAEGRDTLLAGIPGSLIGSFYRSPTNKRVDLTQLIQQLDQLGQLETSSERPLLIFLKNAQRMVEGTLSGRILKDLIQELNQEDQEDITTLAPSTSSLPDTPEALIFGGSDERLPYIFFERALSVQKSIVRLRVPHIFGAIDSRKHALGTGWLITPQLVLTNHHVIEARTANEIAASPTDFQTQAEQTIAWFDYHIEERGGKEWPCARLVWENRQLDYALLRLAKSSDLAYRSPLTIAQQQPLHRADRLNIVQHPGGGLLRYAIRNNFYIGQGETSDFIRYLTDTEGGASGSPVFNDDWLVVAMHHAAKRVRPESYKGETIKYHNEGIEIHSILADFPHDIRQEIFKAQGW